MKRAFALLSGVLLAGCFPAQDFLTTDYDIGSSKTVTVGSPMVTIESGKRSLDGGVFDDLKQEIFYGGVSGSTLKLSYQEFWYPRARPTFTQDLQYDLAKSKEIRFRDVAITVDTADNSSITFRVLDGPTPLPQQTSGLGDNGIVLDHQFVTEVTPKSLGDDAGIRLGDFILSVDGVALTGDNDHDRDILNANLGSSREFKIKRGEKVFLLEVTKEAKN